VGSATMPVNLYQPAKRANGFLDRLDADRLPRSPPAVR
jgi:hypothetical protein